MKDGWAWWLVYAIKATQELKIWRNSVRNQPWKNISKTTISDDKTGCVVHVFHPSYVGGVNRNSDVQESKAKAQDPI
jgi:hypothetical protein